MGRLGLVCWVWLLASSAHGYIPPVRGILENVMGSRQAAGIMEVRLKHRVQVEGDTTLAIDEVIVQDRGKTWVIWSVPGVKNGVGAVYQNQYYRVGKAKQYSSRSGVFMKYLLGDSPEEMLRQLLSEQFVRSDHLSQYSAEFKPEGDPKTWDLRSNYIRHEGISLQRMPQGVSIAVVGLDQSPLKKTVYFDEAARDMVGTQWREGDMVTSWTYGKHGRSKAPGRYPKEMHFVFNGTKRVDTSLVYAVKLRGQAFDRFRSDYNKSDRSGNYSGLVDSALRVLLSYR